MKLFFILSAAAVVAFAGPAAADPIRLSGAQLDQIVGGASGTGNNNGNGNIGNNNGNGNSGNNNGNGNVGNNNGNGSGIVAATTVNESAVIGTTMTGVRASASSVILKEHLTPAEFANFLALHPILARRFALRSGFLLSTSSSIDPPAFKLGVSLATLRACPSGVKPAH
jgi:hypothetical protein